MSVTDLFQTIGVQCNAHCAWCSVKVEKNQQLQICLISFFQHAVRQRACIWRGWNACCFRARLRWKMPALHVSSHSCFLFKAAPATTPRAETVTTKMLRLLVRSTQISVRQVSFNLKKKKCHLHDFLLLLCFHGFLLWRWSPWLALAWDFGLIWLTWLRLG